MTLLQSQGAKPQGLTAANCNYSTDRTAEYSLCAYTEAVRGIGQEQPRRLAAGLGEIDAVEAAFGGDTATTDLATTAEALVAPGKGILAADESTGTIARRFESIGVESTEGNRGAYRELLFTAPGIEAWISGVILFDETFHQSAADGTPLPRLLEGRGIFAGIKVDSGAKPLALAPGETITEGLDGLRERLSQCRELGARFAKWRAVLAIGDLRPSEYAIWTNAHALARYAALSQPRAPERRRALGLIRA